MSSISPAFETASPTAIGNVFEQTGGKAQQGAGISLNTFLVSLVGASITFGVQFLLFLLIKGKLSRI